LDALTSYFKRLRWVLQGHVKRRSVTVADGAK